MPDDRMIPTPPAPLECKTPEDLRRIVERAEADGMPTMSKVEEGAAILAMNASLVLLPIVAQYVRHLQTADEPMAAKLAELAHESARMATTILSDLEERLSPGVEND